MSTAPFQLMNGPFEVYVSDTVELPPSPALPKASIAGNWSLLGVSGDKDITEDGISVIMEQDVATWRGLGSVAARKMFRNSQDIIVTFVLADAGIENYAHAMNEAAINLDEQRRRINLLMTADVAQQSLLIRGDDRSPYGAFNTQWWIPRASHDAQLETVYVKGAPVGLQYRWTALDDTTYGLGWLESQDEAS